MKQMNKEEIIQFFINKIIESKILDEVFPEGERDEFVRNAERYLKLSIRQITYKTEKEGSRGHWDFLTETINIDINQCENEEQFSEVVIHELLHVMTTAYNSKGTSYAKIGLQVIDTFSYIQDIERYPERTRGLNEGITDLIAEEISGVSSQEYLKEKQVAKVLFAIIGRKNILEKYFDTEPIEKFWSCADFLEDAIQEKYKANKGKIYHLVNKIVNLLDEQNILEQKQNEGQKLSQDEIKFYRDSEKKMYKSIMDIITLALKEKVVDGDGR